MSTIPLGIQLYTVRDLLADDFAGTIRALAEMGYQGVEFAWIYGDLSPKELADFLKDLNLKCCGLHANLDEIRNPQSIQYQYVKAMECRYITTSQPRAVADDWNAMIPQIANAAKTAADAGVIFTYHNHTQEFAKIDGSYALDILYQQTDPNEVKAELDTCWILKAGEDPAAYISKYAGRTPQLHLKDMNPADQSVTEVGRGSLDVKEVYAAARQAQVEWMIVEQDICKQGPLNSAEISIENLKQAKLA